MNISIFIFINIISLILRIFKFILPIMNDITFSIFNNNQKATNAVKIEFSSSSSLDNALANAVKAVGNTEYIPNIKVNGNKVEAKEVVRSLIINETGVGLDDAFMTKDTAADGETATLINVVRYGQDVVGNEAAALRKAVAELSDFIDDNKAIASTFDKGNQEAGSKYFDFSYTGNVSVASVENKNGSKVYFVAYTVTQTAAEQTYTK